MRRRRRLHYIVSRWYLTGVDIWYDHTRRRWVDVNKEPPAGSYGNMKTRFTLRAAMHDLRVIRELMGDRYEPGIIWIVRRDRKRGRLREQEWSFG